MKSPRSPYLGCHLRSGCLGGCLPCDTHFILPDSDCLPVTLFEAADLWKEAFLTRLPPRSGKSLPMKHPLHRRQAYARDLKVVCTQRRVNADTIGQGALVVSQPHSQLNAGFIVVFGSSHPALFCWKDWKNLKYAECSCYPAAFLPGLLPKNPK